MRKISDVKYGCFYCHQEVKIHTIMAIKDNIDISVDETYLYSLPEKVIDSLELIYFDSTTTEIQTQPFTDIPKSIEENTGEDVNDKKVAKSNECSVCQYVFHERITQEEKKDHYKSDFHRLNLKRSVSNLAPLTESEFDRLIEEESIESLSGSEDSEDESEEDKVASTKLGTILEKFDSLSVDKQDSNEEESVVSFMNTKSPFIYFRSSLIPEDKVFGIYKSLFTEKQLIDDNPKDIIRSLSSAPTNTNKSALFMIGGGHFAGAIISHTPKNIKGNATNHKESRQEQLVNIIESKTYHRYTTRKKQGGSQSASDNARGKANSAGSSIRRYNEQALIKEVRELLSSWKTHLNDCTSIYIRANGASNRRVLIGYEGCVLQNGDDRVRSFPFTTKRATTSELKKAWSNLSYLSLHDIPKANEKLKKKLQKQRDNLKNSQQQATKVEEVASENDLHSNELINFLKKSRAPMLINYIRKHDLSPNYELSPKEQYAHYPTLLHYASSHSFSHMTQVLMVNLKADPTINNKFGKTPVELAGNTATRRMFQVARYSLGENYCDWNAAKVGSPKSKEDVAKEQQEEQDKIDEEKKRIIEEELAKRTEMEMKKPTFSSGGSLGSNRLTNSTTETSGLSDQQKMRIMREQRARAAEARMKNT